MDAFVESDIVTQFCTLGRSCILTCHACSASHPAGTARSTSLANIKPPMTVMSAIEKASPAMESEPRARAIFCAVAGAQLMARSRSDIALYDSLIESYRVVGLLPA